MLPTRPAPSSSRVLCSAPSPISSSSSRLRRRPARLNTCLAALTGSPHRLKARWRQSSLLRPPRLYAVQLFRDKTVSKVPNGSATEVGTLTHDGTFPFRKFC